MVIAYHNFPGHENVLKFNALGGGGVFAVSRRPKYKRETTFSAAEKRDFSIVTPCRILKIEFHIQWTVHRITWQ